MQQQTEAGKQASNKEKWASSSELLAVSNKEAAAAAYLLASMI